MSPTPSMGSAEFRPDSIGDPLTSYAAFHKARITSNGPSDAVAQEYGLAAGRCHRLPSSMVAPVMPGAARRYGGVAQRFQKRGDSGSERIDFVSEIPGSKTTKLTAAFLTRTSSAYRIDDANQIARLPWLSDRISLKRSANAARHVLRREEAAGDWKFGRLAATSRTL
jgi:hypothetical protein